MQHIPERALFLQLNTNFLLHNIYIYIYIYIYIFPFKSKKIEQLVVNIPYIKTKRNKDIFLENK